MVHQTTRKDLRRVFKRLDDEDRQRVLDHAERLAEGSQSGTARKSLSEGDDGLSYVAAVDTDEYEREKKQQEDRVWG